MLTVMKPEILAVKVALALGYRVKKTGSERRSVRENLAN